MINPAPILPTHQFVHLPARAHATPPRVTPLLALPVDTRLRITQASIAAVNGVIAVSLFVCTSIFVVAAVAGFYTYGLSVHSDLLTCFPKGSVSTVARLGIVLSVTGSFPIFMFIVRKSVCKVSCSARLPPRVAPPRRLLFKNSALEKTLLWPPPTGSLRRGALHGADRRPLHPRLAVHAAEVTGIPPLCGSGFCRGVEARCGLGTQLGTPRYVLVTCAIFACSYGIAMAVTDLDTILGLVGSTVGMLVGFTLPAFIFTR